MLINSSTNEVIWRYDMDVVCAPVIAPVIAWEIGESDDHEFGLVNSVLTTQGRMIITDDFAYYVERNGRFYAVTMDDWMSVNMTKEEMEEEVRLFRVEYGLLHIVEG